MLYEKCMSPHDTWGHYYSSCIPDDMWLN